MKSLFKHLCAISDDKQPPKLLPTQTYQVLKLLVALPPMLLMWSLASEVALAQTAVTQLNATYSNNGGDTSGDYNIQGINPTPSTFNQHRFNVGTQNNLKLNSFTLSGNNFQLIQLVNQININRVDNPIAVGKREILFYERFNSTDVLPNINLKPAAAKIMEEALLSDLINRGTDNVFANQGNGQGNNNNIERIDFVETSGLSATAANLNNIGFLVLERGGNDSFKIAAITAVDAAGKPTQFGNLISVSTSNWGQSSFNVLTQVMLKNPADANLRYTADPGAQRISSVFFSFQSLGITANQQFYGYALFPGDVTASNDLVNLTDFPKNTSEAGGGGMDLIAGGGIFSLTTADLVDLEIDKTDNQTTVTSGSPITYQITVKNNGPRTVNSLTVTDTLPAAFQNPIYTPSTGSYDSATGLWTGLNLASGQSITLTIQGTVSATATGTITNTATVQPPAGLTDPIPGNNSSTDKTDILPKPNVLLVKRITALNKGVTTNGGDNLGVYLDEASNPYDDNTLDNPAPPQKPDTQYWPNLNSFLVGGTNGGKVRPGDELEYTIYFLSTGQANARNVLICDYIPSNVTFIPTAFNSFPVKAANGLSTAERGVLRLVNGNTESLTNVNDGDAAQYFPPGVEPASVYPNIDCDGDPSNSVANTNGAIVVNLGDLPFATAPGTPTGSYGWIRFRGLVK
jgi:uncharacterized repeat protein (TIGR01451 family)